MRLKSAIFDMDGTLLDSMGMWHESGNNFVRSQGFEPRENIWEDVRPLTLLDEARYYQKAYSLPLTAEEIAYIITEQVKEFYRNRAKAKPGVKKFLSLLRLEGAQMYVATGTERSLTEAGLHCAGIDGFFKGIITCDEAGAGKDKSAVIFERAMNRLGSNLPDTVVFEDSLPAIRTAKAAGFRIAGVYDPMWEDHQEEIRALSEYYIHSFEEMFEEKQL